MPPVCPLCSSADSPLFHEDRHRPYYRCTTCSLVFVPPEFHLSPSDEKREYDLHRNDPADPGYRTFLNRLAAPLLEVLPPHSRGLDYGCGPGTALAGMLTEHGHAVDRYDPFYNDDRTIFGKTYGFITATEVVEHFRNPGQEFDRLFGMLAPGGTLGIMTKLVKSRDAFEHWHYIRDRTHISFYSRETFAYLADRYRCTVKRHGNDVIIFSRIRNNGSG